MSYILFFLEELQSSFHLSPTVVVIYSGWYGFPGCLPLGLKRPFFILSSDFVGWVQIGVFLEYLCKIAVLDAFKRV